MITKPSLIVGSLFSPKEYELTLRLWRNLDKTVAKKAHIVLIGGYSTIAMMQELLPKELFTDMDIITIRTEKLVTGAGLLLQRGHLPYTRAITHLYNLSDFDLIYSRLITLCSVLPKQIHIINGDQNTKVVEICKKLLYPYKTLEIKGD
jgi:hypothetical protein